MKLQAWYQFNMINPANAEVQMLYLLKKERNIKK